MANKTIKTEEKKPAESRKNPGRDSKGRFVKGQSGNPTGLNGGGRPKFPEELREAFRELTPKAIQTLKEIIENPEAKEADKIKASEVILDRGWGKAIQSVDVDMKSVPQVIFTADDKILD